MEETVCRMASKGDEEDKDDAIYDAKYDGSPNPIHELDGQGGSDASVEAQDRNFDQSRTKHVVDLYGHRDLFR